MRLIFANSMLLAAAASWGLGNIAQKTVLEDLGVLTATGLATLIATSLMVPIVRREGKALAARSKPNLTAALLIAAVFTLATATMHLSFAGTSVTNATFFVNICAVLTPVAGWLLYRECPSLRVWPAGLLTLGGVWTIGGGTLTALAWGDWVGLAAAVIFSFWLPMVGRFVQQSGRAAYLTFVQFAFCGGVCTILGLLTESISWGALGNALPELVLMGVFAKCIAYLLLAVAQKYTPASCAAIVASAEAIFSSVFAQIFLAEQLPPGGVLGAVLIIAAIIIVQEPAPALVVAVSTQPTSQPGLGVPQPET